MNKELDNWIGWIQKRIPEAKKGYNEGWIRQALDGYAQEQIKLLNLDFVSQRSELLKAQDPEVSFDSYVERFYKEPKVEVTYVSKYKGETITEKKLIKQYMKAMCL